MTRTSHAPENLIQPEQQTQHREALILNGIFEQMVAIAPAVPEGFFPMPQKEVVEGLGLLHWQRIGEEIALTLTEEAKKGEQGYEVRCQLSRHPEGDFVLDNVEGDMFSISKHGEGIGLYPVFLIAREQDHFGISDHKGQRLSETELQSCGEFVEAITKRLPEQLQPH